MGIEHTWNKTMTMMSSGHEKEQNGNWGFRRVPMFQRSSPSIFQERRRGTGHSIINKSKQFALTFISSENYLIKENKDIKTKPGSPAQRLKED